MPNTKVTAICSVYNPKIVKGKLIYLPYAYDYVKQEAKTTETGIFQQLHDVISREKFLTPG